MCFSGDQGMCSSGVKGLGMCFSGDQGMCSSGVKGTRACVLVETMEGIC